MPEGFEQLGLFNNEHTSTSYFEQLLSILNVDDSISGWTDSFGKSLNKLTKEKIKKPIKTLSLFSGGGGLDIGFHDTGFDVFQMIEIDNRFFETLSVNSSDDGYFKKAQPLCMDIREFDPPADLDVDFIIGGPPCQTFSAAGRRAAGVSGTDDPRGTLFQEYVRVLGKLQPKGFLFENVYGILGAQGGKPWAEIVQAFESVGYKINFRILDTADYGVPQHRERLIIVGVKDGDFLFPTPSHGPDSQDNRPYYTPQIATSNVNDAKPDFVGGKYGHLLGEIPPGLNYSFYTEKLGHPNPIFAWRSKFSDFLYKADPNMPVRTLKAQGGKYTGPFHWDSRPFSLGELKRLQTFPDNYNFSGSKQTVIMQIGNSVPPQFGRMMALAVLNQIFNVNFPFEINYLSSDAELGFRKRKRSMSKLYQKKATEAISKLKSNTTVTEQLNKPNEVYRLLNPVKAYIGSDFKFIIDDGNDLALNWNVKIEMLKDQSELKINVGDIDGGIGENPSFIIEIHPSKEWNIQYKKVSLCLFSLDGQVYTAAWKMFEHYLFINNIKADLVQLNGYYQYAPQLIYNVITNNEEYGLDIYFDVIRKILNGEGIREILKVEELAFLWSLTKEETVKTLIKLRELGYEIRSEYTNNQIPSGHILIPYAFPTLNPQSVQLKKTLFPSDKSVLV